MTGNEAIKGLNNLFSEYELTLPCTDSLEILHMAVAALEKQIPKKPVQGEPYNWIDSVRVGRRYRNVKKTSYSHACPNCGNTVAQLSGGYCSKCGQAIDWSK